MQCYYQTDYQDIQTRCKNIQESEWCSEEHKNDWQEKNYGKVQSSRLDELRKLWKQTNSPAMKKYYEARAKLITKLGY